MTKGILIFGTSLIGKGLIIDKKEFQDINTIGIEFDEGSPASIITIQKINLEDRGLGGIYEYEKFLAPDLDFEGIDVNKFVNLLSRLHTLRMQGQSMQNKN